MLCLTNFKFYKNLKYAKHEFSLLHFVILLCLSVIRREMLNR